MSEYAAFAYTTALNRLVSDREHCKRVGDTTILCWAENAKPVYQDAMSMFLFGADETSGIQENDLRAALEQLAAGQTVPFLGEDLSPGQHFYLLGLAPNASRLSVRFFLRDTFGRFAENLQKHAAEMEIICSEKEKVPDTAHLGGGERNYPRCTRADGQALAAAGWRSAARCAYRRALSCHAAQWRDHAHPCGTGCDPRPGRCY